MAWFEKISALVLPAFGKSTADATGETGTMRAANTAGSVTLAAIPAEMKGRMWNALSAGASTQYAITVGTDTAPTLVYNQIAVFGTGHPAAGQTLVDGARLRFFVPSNARVITVISSAAAGFTEFTLSGVKK